MEKPIRDMTHAEAHKKLLERIDKIEMDLWAARDNAGKDADGFKVRTIHETFGDYDFKCCIERLEEEEN